jgi:transposase
VADAISVDLSFNEIDVWWQDEARIGQQGSITRMWAPKGTRPRAIRQRQFEYAYLYGAVCPSRDEGVALVLPVANSEAMSLHLEEISKKTEPGRVAVVIMDQAGWHTSSKLKEFSNVIPIMLPPYSPELNPVEQVWKQLREDSLANRCYENYEDIVQSCAKAWMAFTGGINNVRSLCSRDWANLANI